MRNEQTRDAATPRPPRRRRLPVAGALAGCALAVALAGAAVVPDGADAKKAPRLIRAHTVLGVQCVPGPSNTVRARVRVRMTVVNYDGVGDWADRMETKVRLVPTTSGLNITRSWRSAKSQVLTQNRKHRLVFTVTSDNVGGNADWRAQIKLIWHRPAPIRNIATTVHRTFNGSCADPAGGGGFLPGPAPALPSPGSG